MKQTVNHIKLGIFVLGGLLFLVFLLYMIGRNRNMFGSHLTLKARFSDADGLKPGNNVRYSGIEVGTVSYVRFVNDTTVEIGMTIQKELDQVIRANAKASIGTDGLVGNKVVNIIPGSGNAAFVVDNSMLEMKPGRNVDDMLVTLSQTNDDAAVIAAQLKTVMIRINASKGFWQLLNDPSIPLNLRLSARNISRVTANTDSIGAALWAAMDEVKQGKGVLGTMLYDTALTSQLHQLLAQFQRVGMSADSLSAVLTASVANINGEIMNGNGTLHNLLRDTALAGKLDRSLQHIEKGANGFNQNMEALKHHFLFSGYFRKLEKQQQAAQKK